MTPKINHSLLTVVLVGAAATALAAPDVTALPSTDRVETRLETARVPFIANTGQLPGSEVALYARMFAGTLFVTDDGDLVYALLGARVAGMAPTVAFTESFADSRVVRPVGADVGTAVVSQFKGPDPATWRSGLPTWNSVDLGERYPGVRITLRAAGNNVEKLFHVAPGGDVAAIDVAVDGADGVELDRDGRLVLRTELGDVVFTAPEAYQVTDGRRQPVDVAYALNDRGHYGFEVGAYDRERELVIDPLLASTYLGGHNPNPPGNYDDDIIYAMAMAGDDLVVAGVTQSPDFPIVMGYDPTLASSSPDGFVARISADLSTIIASTYLGTEGFDRVTDVAVDSAGSIVVTGEAGWGFPVTAGAYTWSGSTPTGGGFIARLSGDLASLEGSAIPTPGDYPQHIELGNGGIYFGGSTNNASFPITPGAYRDTCCPAGSFGIPEYDGFAGRLSADLTTLDSLTYLGGQTVSGIAVADDGSVYLTDGWDYAVTGYIARFDAGLTDRESYLSYYPGSTSGSSRTYFNDVAVVGGRVVAVGETYMNDLPATPGAFDTTCGTDGLCDGVGPLLVPRSDGFVAIYSQDLQSTVALTFLGGSYFESIRSVDVGVGGDIIVAGETRSVDFPTAGAGADTDCGIDGACDAGGGSAKRDGFIARLSADLSQLSYGSYLGGSMEDRPLDVVLDDMGRAYVGGFTDSVDFPTTPGAFDLSYNGGTHDAFISWIDIGSDSPMIFTDDFESGDMTRWDLY